MFVFVVEARQLCAEAEEFIAKAVQVLLLVDRRGLDKHIFK